MLSLSQIGSQVQLFYLYVGTYLIITCDNETREFFNYYGSHK